MALAKKAVQEDRRLERAHDSTFEVLCQHRWHWTLDESNAKRVSMREYAEAIGRNESTVRRQAKGYADWTAASRGRTLADCVATASMSVETAAAYEAVAEARGVTVQSVRNSRPVEAKRVREIARQRAEDRGTTIEEETTKAATWIVKSEQAEESQRTERAKRTSLRAVSVEEKVRRMIRIGIDALAELRGVELDNDSQELLEGALVDLRAVARLLDMAIVGAVEIDWDAEFSKLAEVE